MVWSCWKQLPASVDSAQREVAGASKKTPTRRLSKLRTKTAMSNIRQQSSCSTRVQCCVETLVNRKAQGINRLNVRLRVGKQIVDLNGNRIRSIIQSEYGLCGFRLITAGATTEPRETKSRRNGGVPEAYDGYREQQQTYTRFSHFKILLTHGSFSATRNQSFGFSLGGHPKPAIKGHFKTGQR